MRSLTLLLTLTDDYHELYKIIWFGQSFDWAVSMKSTVLPRLGTTHMTSTKYPEFVDPPLSVYFPSLSYLYNISDHISAKPLALLFLLTS